MSGLNRIAWSQARVTDGENTYDQVQAVVGPLGGRWYARVFTRAGEIVGVLDPVISSVVDNGARTATVVGENGETWIITREGCGCG